MKLDALVSSPGTKSALNGLLGGVAGGAIAGALTRKKSTKKLLKAGGMVALGGLAWSAYQKYRDSQGGQSADLPIQDRSAYAQPSSAALKTDEHRLLAAMVAAANADGHVTESEQVKIWQKTVELGLDTESMAFVKAALQEPPTISEIAEDASDLETGLEIYTASLVVIDDECAAGRAYLNDLEHALNLPSALVKALSSEQELAVAAA